MGEPSEVFEPSEEEEVDSLVDSESSQTDEQDSSDDSGRPAFWPRGLGKLVGGQPFPSCQRGQAASTWDPSTCGGPRVAGNLVVASMGSWTLQWETQGLCVALAGIELPM